MELKMLRAQMAIAAARVTELESEKTEFEEIRLELENKVKALEAELEGFRSGQSKDIDNYESALREAESELAAERQKRLDEFNLFEKKKAELLVRFISLCNASCLLDMMSLLLFLL